MTVDIATALQLTRIVNTDPATAFAAWTEPLQMQRWTCPNDASILDVQADPKVGGSYLIKMLGGTGLTHTAVGEYRDVDPPHRLVYSWDWQEDDMRMGIETLVTVEFREHPDGTEVVLTHEGFPVAEATQGHEEGWSSCLDKYAQLFA